MKTKFWAVKSVMTVVAVAGLTACSTGKTNTQASNAEYAKPDRTPAQSKGVEMALEDFVKYVSKGSKAGEEDVEAKTAAYIRKNAKKWGVPDAEGYGKPGAKKLTAEQESFIAKKLVEEAALYSKAVGVQEGVVKAYAQTSRTGGSWSSMPVTKTSGLKSLEGSAEKSTGDLASYEKRLSAIENPTSRSIASKGVQSVLEFGKKSEDAAVKALTVEIADHAVNISNITKEPFLVEGCNKLDKEALTNFNEIEKGVEKRVAKGESAGAATREEWARVTEEDPALVCQTRVRETAENCGIIDTKIAETCEVGLRR